jgi:formate C-acetyltransferase
MATASSEVYSNTARVNADDARIDALKEQLRSTPQEVDYERHIIMRDVYEETAGVNEIIRRAKLIAATVERKQIYIDDNLFVGSITGTVNGVYPYPEWNVEWMKEENTVEKSKTPELRAANEWAAPYRRNSRKAVWLRSGCGVRLRPRCQFP